MNIKILIGLTVYLYLFGSNLWAEEYLSIKKDWEGVEREYLIYLPNSYKENKENLGRSKVYHEHLMIVKQSDNPNNLF